MSQYVVHFTKNSAVFAQILASGVLRPSGPFGFSWARKVVEVQNRHLSVCFSEVPVDRIKRIADRHGHYGIAFTKDFIRNAQGARVWYVDQGSEQARNLNRHLGELRLRRDFAHPMWELTPFMDLVMPGQYEWDWEREWRVRNELRFRMTDVAFVITPEGVGEMPELHGLYSHPKLDLIVAATPQPLVDLVEDLVKEFVQTFENPVDNLPVDDGEYVWIVNEWNTEGCVDELFPELSDDVRPQLIDYLDGISHSWVRSSDVASIYE